MVTESGWVWTTLLVVVVVVVSSDLSPEDINHICECSAETSELSKDGVLPETTGGRTYFVCIESCTERRQTGQVDCFLSHISIQERWKLCPHLGMILNISFSWYSAKHIAHLKYRGRGSWTGCRTIHLFLLKYKYFIYIYIYTYTLVSSKTKALSFVAPFLFIY